MQDGAIAAWVDTPEQLFRAPASAWVCEFVGAGNVLRGTLTPVGDRLRLQMGQGSTIEVHAVAGAEPAGAVQVPFDKLRLERCDDGAGLPVTGRRFLGSAVELHLATANGVLRALLPMDAAAEFPVGSHARVAADAADCRLLPDR